ncbi:MAG: DNA repair protein RecN [Sphaerochaetaceae bacterium]|nr:DNA repair protein RecN [Sphaerochaetaceae bacterium]
MLEHLEIRNFALIENLCVDFSDGFNVITGETGAGKSIILGALGLLMGEKADTSAVRTGTDEIVINAIVSIPENHEILPWLAEKGVQPEDGVIYIKRTVKANGGRSIIHVQNQLFSRQDLCHLADSIIDMHGQSEHQSLLLPDRQRKIVDSYAQNAELLQNCAEAFRQIGVLVRQKEDLAHQLEEGRRQQDYLQFALEDIDNANIQVGEDEDLKERVRVLGQFESIYENVTLCNEKLRDARTVIFDALSSCTKAAKCDPNLSEYTARLESARIEAEDIASGLRDYLGSVNYSEDAINSMQDRLATLQKLKRKYGPSLDDVLSFAQKARDTLDLTQNFEEHLAQCQKNLDKAQKQYDGFAAKLRTCRKKAAKDLEARIQSVLRTLGMPDAVFEISITDGKATASGTDVIDFMISANPGEPKKDIRSIASGGELSRVMLALKTVLAKADDIQTQVFDEVDSGIGGAVALSLAKCISDLAQSKQVIAITHLASIASTADTHMVVSKSVEKGRTYTHLKQVSGETRVHEIARMLSGDESEVSLEHARRMLGA